MPSSQATWRRAVVAVLAMNLLTGGDAGPARIAGNDRQAQARGLADIAVSSADQEETKRSEEIKRDADMVNLLAAVPIAGAADAATGAPTPILIDATPTASQNGTVSTTARPTATGVAAGKNQGKKNNNNRAGKNGKKANANRGKKNNGKKNRGKKGKGRRRCRTAAQRQTRRCRNRGKGKGKGKNRGKKNNGKKNNAANVAAVADQGVVDRRQLEVEQVDDFTVADFEAFGDQDEGVLAELNIGTFQDEEANDASDDEGEDEE